MNVIPDSSAKGVAKLYKMAQLHALVCAMELYVK